MTVRSSAKDMALWMSANAATAPVSGDLIAFTTGLTPTVRSSPVALTSAGDTWARKGGGIPDASCRFTGRWSVNGGVSSSQRLFAAVADQLPRQFFLLWDDNVPGVGLLFTGIVSEVSPTGQFSGPWDFSAAIDIDGAVSDDRTA